VPFLSVFFALDLAEGGDAVAAVVVGAVGFAAVIVVGRLTIARAS